MKEIKVLAERWRMHYNTVRPHSSRGYKPAAPAARLTSTNMGHATVESIQRFPLLHTPDCGYLSSPKTAVHKLSNRHK